MVEWICPECVQGKCGNCTGYAWDFQKDQSTKCECTKRGHDV